MPTLSCDHPSTALSIAHHLRPLLGLLALAAVCCSTGLQPTKAAEQPNIIVFLVDDMGVMDTSLPFLTDAQGNPQRHPLNEYYRTPNMERLAQRGIRFNQFYAMSVCSPTRVSILTGQNAARHHTTNWINPDNNNAGPYGPPDWNWQGLTAEDTTLPRQLQAAGYRTIHVGKGHFGPRDSVGAEPKNLGFDVNIAGCSIGAPGSYYGEKNYGHGGRRETHAVPGLEKYHGTETFLSEALTIEAQSAVAETVEAEQPFFLYFAHYAVHAPFDSDPRFAAHYADSGKSPQAQAFATLIEGMDKSLGDMLDQLDSLGVAEETLILFLGDNGSDAPLGHQHAVACAAPLRGKKGAHYEGGMRVPFIAAWGKPSPDNRLQQRLPIPPGAIQPQMASVVDVFPTLLKLVGQPVPSVDGTPLQTLLSGQADPAHASEFLMHYPHAPHRSVYFTVYRQGDWKVIYHYYPSEESEGSRYQLYNLATDPYESQNVAESKPDVLRRLLRGLIAQMSAHNAQYPLAADGQSRLQIELP